MRTRTKFFFYTNKRALSFASRYWRVEHFLNQKKALVRIALHREMTPPTTELLRLRLKGPSSIDKYCSFAFRPRCDTRLQRPQATLFPVMVFRMRRVIYSRRTRSSVKFTLLETAVQKKKITNFSFSFIVAHMLK